MSLDSLSTLAETEADSSRQTDCSDSTDELSSLSISDTYLEKARPLRSTRLDNLIEWPAEYLLRLFEGASVQEVLAAEKLNPRMKGEAIWDEVWREALKVEFRHYAYVLEEKRDDQSWRSFWIAREKKRAAKLSEAQIKAEIKTRHKRCTMESRQIRLAPNNTPSLPSRRNLVRQDHTARGEDSASSCTRSVPRSDLAIDWSSASSRSAKSANTLSTASRSHPAASSTSRHGSSPSIHSNHGNKRAGYSSIADLCNPKRRRKAS